MTRLPNESIVNSNTRKQTQTNLCNKQTASATDADPANARSVALMVPWEGEGLMHLVLFFSDVANEVLASARSNGWLWYTRPVRGLSTC